MTINSWWIWPLVTAIFLIPLFFINPSNHRQKIKAGNRHLAYIRTLREPELIFNYLRNQVDPYEFEEMVLTAFKRSGAKVKRNIRYSHDFGLDGRVYIKRKLYLIQSKKYKGYINSRDVADFREICLKSKKAAGGYFVHCGKTGPKSLQSIGDGDIELISGDRLLKLFTGGK